MKKERGEKKGQKEREEQTAGAPCKHSSCLKTRDRLLFSANPPSLLRCWWSLMSFPARMRNP